jgi:hypothetical protein
MTSGNRLTWGFVLEILDVLERHGYHQHDEQHTGHAVLLIGDLASAYTGRDTHPGRVPGPAAEADRDTAALAGTIMAALDMGAGAGRDRAGTCAGCTDRSCPACGTPRPMTGPPRRSRAATGRPASDRSRQETSHFPRPPPGHAGPGPGLAYG